MFCFVSFSPLFLSEVAVIFGGNGSWKLTLFKERKEGRIVGTTIFDSFFSFIVNLITSVHDA